MPRDAANTYTLPSAPFTPATIAQPEPVNANFSDIASALTASLTRGETTPFARTLLDDPDAASARATLGIGTAGYSLQARTVVQTSQATVDFAIPSDAIGFQIEATNVVPSTNNAFLGLQVSTDGGATYVSTSSYFTVGGQLSGSYAGSFDASARTLLGVTGSIVSALGDAARVQVEMDVAAPYIALWRSHRLSASASGPIYGGGFVQTAGRVTNVRLLMSTGNIASGDFRFLVMRSNPSVSAVGTPWQIVFKPYDNEPPAANFATLDTRNGHPILDFDTTTQEAAIFSGVLPFGYGGRGVTVYVYSTLASATSGTLGWDVSFERMDAAGLDIDADSWSTPTTITAATVPGTSGQIMRQSVNIADGTAMDGLLAGEAFRLRVRRDVANDTAAGDAELLRVVMVEQ